MSISETQETGGIFRISCRRLEDAESARLQSAGYAGDGFVVALSGELDLATVPIAEAELMRVEASHDLVVLDLRGLTFADSTGLRLMISADRRARERNASFVIVDGPPSIRRLFDLSGVAGHLEVIDDLGAEPARAG